MNRYESILLDKMVDINNKYHDAITARGYSDEVYEVRCAKVLLLLDCICDFREPPRALDVADGYGALATVDERGEVVA